MSPLYNDIKCQVCGEAVEQSGKGRPKEYHTECRRIAQQMSWLEDILAGDMKKNEATKKYVKSNMTRLSNLTNTWR